MATAATKTSAGQVNGFQASSPSSSSGLPLEALSHTISGNASILSGYLRENGLPQPSFEGDGPSVVVPSTSPQAIQEAREKLIAASLEIFHLATGPRDFLPNLATGFQYVSCISWLTEYRIFHLVPVGGEISYDDLAAASGAPAQRLRAIVRMAMTDFVFRESPDGTRVKHSATSAMLAQSPDAYAYATYMCRKSAPMAMQMTAAHRRWGPATVQKYETAYNEAFNTDLPFFDHLSRDKERMALFAEYMRSVRTSEGVDIKHLTAGYDWKSVRDGGLVVDIGGSTGTAASALATSNAHLKFIVQDLPENAEKGRALAAANLAGDIAERITFQGYNFMQPQPVRGADVYLLRMILHDWADGDAAAILRNVAAAIDPGRSRLLIMDTVLPEPGSVPVSAERIQRSRDLTMMQAFNSKERHIGDWRELLAMADGRFEIRAVHQPFGSAMSILEVTLA